MKISYKPHAGQYQVLVKKEYHEWSNSDYSPNGVFKYEFPMSEFLIPSEGRTLHPTETKLVITIVCEMQNNKFINLNVTEHMSELNLGITHKDILENMRTSSVIVFDYDLSKILPFPMWKKSNISDYIDKSPNEEYSMHIKSVLLATEYIHYSNYLMSKPYALWLISQPSFFRRNNILDKTSNATKEVLDINSFNKVSKMIENISSDLYMENGNSSSGKLTTKGENILYDFLHFNGYDKSVNLSFK